MSLSGLADEQLVSMYRAGKPRAFEELVRRYQGPIYRFCLGMTGDFSLSEDLTQAAFVKAAMALERLREPDKFRSWLYVLARNAVYDWSRRRSRRGWDQEEALGPAATDLETVQSIETKDAVRRVLATLASSDKEVLLLVDLLGLSMAEVAEALGLQVSAAKMRLSRARHRFRELYGQLAGDEQ